MKKYMPYVWDFILIIIGSATFALSVNLFLNPYQIITGGVTGIAMLIHHIFPQVGIGVITLLFNIPLFIIGRKKLGLKFFIYSLVGTLVSSLMIDLTSFIKPVETDHLLAALAGGIMMGLGLGLVFTRGATTGGSDILARLLKFIFPHMQMGIMMFIIDAFIITASAFVYGNINPALLAVLAIYICSKMIDAILYGSDIERVAYIISNKNDEIVAAISDNLGRGSTYLNGEGTYSHAPRKIILCAIKRNQIPQLKELVKNIDSQAFIIITQAHEILGEGFKDHKKITF